MLIGSLPFKANSSENEIINQILTEPTPYPLNSWKKITFCGKEFVMGLLQKDPTKRMTIKEAIEHEWLNIKKDKQKSNNNLFGASKTKSYFAEYCNISLDK